MGSPRCFGDLRDGDGGKSWYIVSVDTYVHGSHPAFGTVLKNFPPQGIVAATS